MSKTAERSFGATPSPNHFTEEYLESFIYKWDTVIDWGQRARNESDLFIKLLKDEGAHRVLDVTTGTGFHSVRMLEAGLEVVGADGNADILAKARRNARDRGYNLQTVRADWRRLTRDIEGRYDAVVCMDNSFSYLFKEDERRDVLAEFLAILEGGGILILRQRNYDNILDRDLRNKHKYSYCSDQVMVEVEHVEAELARFRYQFADGSIYHVNTYPLRMGHARELLRQAGFTRVQTYGDTRDGYRAEEPDFLIHIGQKPRSEDT